MNVSTKKLVQSYLQKYLEKKFPNLKINKSKFFECPFIYEHSDSSTKPTCQIQSKNGFKLKCYHTSHGNLGNIFSIVRKVEPSMKDLSDEDIADYLIVLLDIKTNEETHKLLSMYSDAGFCLIPVQKEGKAPIQQDWQKSQNKNVNEWQEWIDSGLNIGLNLGKKSNVIAIDVDSKETFEKIKDKLNDTAMQTTAKGFHFLYEYEDEFEAWRSFDCRKHGLDLEFKSNGTQIVIAPSSTSGEKRFWNDKTIVKMAPELKEFIKNMAEPKTDEVQEKLEDIKLNGDLKGLDGCCNKTFTQLGGILSKTMPLKYVEKSLYNFNKLLNDPMAYKDIKSMMYQIKRYRNYDKKELADEVLNHLKVIEQTTARDLQSSLLHEKKEIEEVLKYLIDEGKVIKIGHIYKLVNVVEWETNFMSTGKTLPFEVPYFSNYARFEDGSMVIIGARSGRGKCFAKGTKILMYDGSIKNVENIKKHDKLMGVDSTARNVLGTCIGTDTMYEIIPTKGKSFVVNSEHILSLKKTGTNKIVNIKLNEFLDKSDKFQKQHLLYRVPVNFKPKKLSIEPYYLGLWLGDGDSRDSRITTIDKEIYDYVKNYAKRIGLLFRYYKYKNRAGSVKVCNTQGNHQNKFSIQKELRKLNLLQNKHIPDVYKINSRKNRLELLAGLMDSDGHLSNGCTFEITTKFDKLADDIEYLAGSLGFLVNKRIKKIKYNNKIKKYWRISIIGDCSKIPVKLKRKQAQPKKINKDPLKTNFKVKKLKKDNYYGFFLDGDHLHLLDNFIVNHNTHVACNIIEKLVKNKIAPYYICTEAGSKFGKISATLGLKEGDFYYKVVSDASNVELEDDAVTIIDWLKPIDSDYAKTDMIYQRLNEQLVKHRGLLIVFAQLKGESNTFYAENMVHFFASFVAKYNWTPLKNTSGQIYDYDMNNTEFATEKIRDSKNGKQFIKIPMYFDSVTKELKLRGNK